ncbi:coniferyl aldehyde dehydrogenase [Marinomonas agarivorans]|nr:coniferyl aldehyde dehydrogenase [Marinomonas agarivorans]
MSLISAIPKADDALESTLDDTLLTIFNTQRNNYLNHRYPSYEDRLDNLQTLYRLIDLHSAEIAQALNKDFGCRAVQETEMVEIIGSLSSIRYLMKNLRRFMAAQKRHTSIWFLPATNKVHLQPLGVIGVMAPWNYSVHLTIAPVATALAAGNRVMAKMSELTPCTSALLNRLITDAFDKDTLAIIEGDADISRAFSELPFDHLLFTGSTAVGKKIALAAAQNLTPVTLELSGKSPVIIDKNYPIEEAAKRTLWGKVFNAGQTCIAPDYVLVHEDKLLEFVRAARKTVTDFYPNGIDTGDYTAVINRQHFNRLQSLLDDAKAKGCEIISLAKTVEQTHKLAPTLVIQPTKACELFDEELFGPVLPVFTYNDIDDAIKQVDAHPDPLALYIFSKQKTQVAYITQRIRAGSTLVNDTLLQYLQTDLPFGGVGNSGNGKYHGREGFEAFSNKQATVKQRGLGHFTGIKLLYPPYSGLAKLMKTLIRKWP